MQLSPSRTMVHPDRQADSQTCKCANGRQLESKQRRQRDRKPDRETATRQREDAHLVVRPPAAASSGTLATFIAVDTQEPPHLHVRVRVCRCEVEPYRADLRRRIIIERGRWRKGETGAGREGRCQTDNKRERKELETAMGPEMALREGSGMM